MGKNGNNFVLFTGRPNAGKSSVIREVLGIDVTVGKKPGTTRKISKYPLSKGLTVVDMPGFGKMMGASKRLEDIINDRIVNFLESKAHKVEVAVHVLNISTFLEVTRRLEKKGIISVDVEMVQFLADTLHEFPLVAANKIDKGSDREIVANLQEFIYRISDGTPSQVEDYVFPTSIKTGQGLGPLKSAIHNRLVVKGYRTPFK
ncbi:MAG: GTPase [Thermoproteota archaeon]